MTNFLLLHGAFQGAWCWERLAPELAAFGHSVFALDLPGHGNDARSRKDITRQTYIRAVGDFLRKEDLSDVTIVGHSLAGAILPEIWRDNRERIQDIIFLAALVLAAGEAPIALIPEERRMKYFEQIKLSTDNSLPIDSLKARRHLFADLTEEDAQIFSERLTPQPFGAFLDRCEVDPDFAAHVSVRYVLCTLDQVLPRALCLSCAAKLDVSVEQIEAGHAVMLTRPRELAELLLKGP